MARTMEATTPPEVLRTNLSSFILTLKALGVHNILAFDLMDSPSVDALSHGLECLYALDAIDDQTNLTSRGMDMASFPTEPRVSRMLLESGECFHFFCTYFCGMTLSQVNSETHIHLLTPHLPLRHWQYTYGS